MSFIVLAASQSFPWGAGAVNWQEAETPLAWLGDVGGNYTDRGIGNGYLVITNQRVLFLKKSGVIGKNYSFCCGVEIADSLSVVTSGDRTAFSFRSFGHAHRLVISHEGFDKSQVQNLVNVTNKAVTARKAMVKEEHEETQTSSPTVVKEIHHVVVKIPCRYCGLLNDQIRNKCEGCGAPLR